MHTACITFEAHATRTSITRSDLFILLYVPMVIVTMIGLTAALRPVEALVERLTIIGPSAIALTTLQLANASTIQSSINVSNVNGLATPTRLLIASYVFMLLPVLHTSLALCIYDDKGQRLWPVHTLLPQQQLRRREHTMSCAGHRSTLTIRLLFTLLLLAYSCCCLYMIVPPVRPAALQISNIDDVSITNSPYAVQSTNALAERLAHNNITDATAWVSRMASLMVSALFVRSFACKLMHAQHDTHHACIK